MLSSGRHGARVRASSRHEYSWACLLCRLSPVRLDQALFGHSKTQARHAERPTRNHIIDCVARRRRVHVRCSGRRVLRRAGPRHRRRRPAVRRAAARGIAGGGPPVSIDEVMRPARAAIGAAGPALGRRGAGDRPRRRRRSAGGRAVDDALIYDWNRRGAGAAAAAVLLNDETLRDGLQSPSVRAPSIDAEARASCTCSIASASTPPTSACPAPARTSSRDVERLAREIVDGKPAASRPTAPRGRSSPTSSRSPTSCSGPACRSSAAASSARARSAATPKTGRSTHLQRCTEEAVGFAVSAGADGDVRHRGHDALRSRDAAAAVHDGDPRRRVAHLHRRHRRPRHAGRRAGGRPFRATDHRGDAAATRRHRLARPPRPRHGHDQQHRGARSGRDARPRHGPRARRAGRQHADGSAAGESGADGLDRRAISRI